MSELSEWLGTLTFAVSTQGLSASPADPTRSENGSCGEV